MRYRIQAHMNASRAIRARQIYLFGGMLLALVAAAAEYDKKTIVQVAETARVGGVVLPPGRYVFKLFNSLSNRNIVQILNQDESTVLGTLFAVPKFRSVATPETRFVLGEARRGEPVPIRAWFYAGDASGYEFIDTPNDSMRSFIQVQSGSLVSTTHSLSRASFQEGAVGEKWALIVGISRFLDSDQDLHFAAKDAIDMASALADPEVGRFTNDPSHLRLLMNENATLSKVRRELADLSTRAAADDLVLIFFSTHGTPDGHLATFETGASTPEVGLSLDELFSTVRTTFQARRIVIFVDGCFSGKPSSVPGAKALRFRFPMFSVRPPPQPSGVAFLASSQWSEESFELDHLNNSAFTFFVIEALRVSAGAFTVKEIFDYVTNKVPAAVWVEKHMTQHPVMWSDHNGWGIQIGTHLSE